MKFIKMHGLGNDYVYAETFTQKLGDVNDLARKVSDRHFGIGSDGLILVMPSELADVRMRMFNVDGSEGEMCGNGVRCVAKFAYDHGLAKVNPMRVETGRGVLSIALDVVGGKVRTATVNMGTPILDYAKIPVNSSHFTGSGPEHELELLGAATPAVFVSMGNPHVVSFTRDLQSVDLNRVGPAMETHPAFPRRVNAHWAQVFSPTEIAMRTWERGSGITLACGTGACSVLVAGVLTGRTARKATIHLPGGDLQVEWRESDGCVYMTGPATEVFRGEWAE
jgi:diaminopimelate epimerase